MITTLTTKHVAVNDGTYDNTNYEFNHATDLQISRYYVTAPKSDEFLSDSYPTFTVTKSNMVGTDTYTNNNTTDRRITISKYLDRVGASTTTLVVTVGTTVYGTKPANGVLIKEYSLVVPFRSRNLYNTIPVYYHHYAGFSNKVGLQWDIADGYYLRVKIDLQLNTYTVVLDQNDESYANTFYFCMLEGYIDETSYGLSSLVGAVGSNNDPIETLTSSFAGNTISKFYSNSDTFNLTSKTDYTSTGCPFSSSVAEYQYSYDGYKYTPISDSLIDNESIVLPLNNYIMALTDTIRRQSTDAITV